MLFLRRILRRLRRPSSTDLFYKWVDCLYKAHKENDVLDKAALQREANKANRLMRAMRR